MQIMAHHENAAVERLAKCRDQIIEARLACLVEPLGRLVEHDQVRAPQQGMGKQRALHLPARQGAQLATAEASQPHLLKAPLPLPRIPAGQREEIVDHHRQRPVDGDLLRDVANAKTGGAADATAARRQGADQQAEKRALTGSVRTDDRHDLATPDCNIDIPEDPLSAQRQTDPRRLDEGAVHYAASSRQEAQSPSASTTMRSIVKPAAEASASRPGNSARGVSATLRQARQTRKPAACRSPACMQAAKAPSRSMR